MTAEPPESEPGPSADAAATAAANRRRSLVVALLGVLLLAVLILAVRQGGDDDPTPPAEVSVPTQAQELVETAEVPVGTEGPELGSLLITANICPDAASPDDLCLAGPVVDLRTISIELPDGSITSLEMASKMEDGSYIWLNVPTGEYSVDISLLIGPEGYAPRNLTGQVVPLPNEWMIKNTDPNQPAVIHILFAPVGGSPAAG